MCKWLIRMQNTFKYYRQVKADSFVYLMLPDTKIEIFFFMLKPQCLPESKHSQKFRSKEYGPVSLSPFLDC